MAPMQPQSDGNTMAKDYAYTIANVKSLAKGEKYMSAHEKKEVEYSKEYAYYNADTIADIADGMDSPAREGRLTL